MGTSLIFGIPVAIGLVGSAAVGGFSMSKCAKRSHCCRKIEKPGLRAVRSDQRLGANMASVFALKGLGDTQKSSADANSWVQNVWNGMCVVRE